MESYLKDQDEDQYFVYQPTKTKKPRPPVFERSKSKAVTPKNNANVVFD